MSNSLMTIALHRIKEKHNIKTKVWAQMSGVPESTIYRFLNSSVNIPNFPAVCAMLKCLGESIDDFYDRLDAKIDTPADALGLDVTSVDAIDDIHVDAPEARAEIQERIIRQAEEIQTQQMLIRERDAYIELLNAKLIDLPNLIKCRVLICAVLRDGQAMVPNSGHFTFLEGDRVFVTAPSKNLATLLKNLGIITRRVRSVMICGAGRVCYYLASSLLKNGISVKIVERNPVRCSEIKNLLPEADVIQGDAGDMELLESENLRNYDALVTLTGEDELNMIVSLYAGSAGVPQVITKLGHASHRSIIDTLNLGSVVCPKDLVVSNIVRYVRAMQNQTGAALSVHSIADGQVEAMEFMVDKNTKYCDIPLKNLRPKPNVLIAGITHGAWTEIPNGDSAFHRGDSVVVVTRGDASVRQLNDCFE